MKLEVTQQEAVFIINVIGELPSKTGASALYENLKRQFETANAPQPVETVPEGSS